MIDADVKNAEINYESLQESRNSRSQSAPSASVNTERVTLLSFVLAQKTRQPVEQGVELKLKHVQAVGVYGWSSVCETIFDEWFEDISQNQDFLRSRFQCTYSVVIVEEWGFFRTDSDGTAKPKT
ncbi:hypothetical protein Tco_0975306 [Tanacetum coccineum]|uniref:Autophagy-related protein 2 n=1 Tax=Tanacetum coccineum TaxID=301880 RepID=A0ABQ5EE03_9ASTR